jgi:hypothetical protein
MKQIIFSVAVLIFALTGKAQTHLAFTKAPLTYDSITIRVLKTTEGEVVKTLRYYTAVDVLPVHIRARLTERFPEYIPTAITELYDFKGLAYIINVSKGNQWLQLHLSPNGRIRKHGPYYNSSFPASYPEYTSTLP